MEQITLHHKMKVLLIKLFSFLLFFMTINPSIYSQESAKFQFIKTSQTGERFEIIQSEISSIYTFKVDKYLGKVYVIVHVPEFETPTWLEIPKSYVKNDTIKSEKINYQLFLGGNSVVDCYLLNINSGSSWILKNENKKGLLFKGFDTSLD